MDLFPTDVSVNGHMIDSVFWLAWISTDRNSPNNSRPDPTDQGVPWPDDGCSGHGRGRLAERVCYVVMRKRVPFHQGTLIGLSSIPEAMMIGRCALR